MALEKSAVSVGVILITNLLVLAGFLFLDWTISDIIILYWAETGIIGLFTILKIILAQGSTGPNQPKMAISLMGKQSEIQLVGMLQKLFIIPFFMFHFGVFMSVHLIFLVIAVIPMFGEIDRGALWQIIANVALGLVLLLASHGLSFLINYIGKKEYERAEPGRLMAAPYGRVIAMQVFIVIGSMVLGMLDPSSSRLMFNTSVCVIVLGKIAFDIFSHVNEHGLFST